MPDLGSAQFFDPTGQEDAMKNGKVYPKDHILFGYAGNVAKWEVSNYFVSLPVKSHFLTIAQNRSGKAVSLLVPNLLNYCGSAVVVDVKGELAWLTSNFRKEHHHQKIFIIDPWGEVKNQYADNARKVGIEWPEPKTSTFNPLALLDPKSDHYSEDLAYISDALIINQSSSQPFFDDSARELVAGLISFMVEYDPENATFDKLRALISMPLSQIKARAIEAQKFGGRSLAKRKLGMFAEEGGSDKELSSILSTAKQQTAFLDSEALCDAMEGGEDIFSALLSEQGATIYLVLPVDKLQTFGRWLRLMISFAIRTVARYPGKLENQVMLFLDEFGTIGKLSAVSTAYGLMAGRNLSCWTFLQDLNQLKKDYPKEWETFIANSQAITVFGVQDQTTAEYFSKQAGTTTIERISVATAEARKKNPGYSNMADQSFTRQLLLPEEIIKLTVASGNHGLIFGLGNPIIYERMRYYNQKCFQKAAAPNPLVPEDVKKYKEQNIKEKMPAAIQEAQRQYPNLEAFNGIIQRAKWTIKTGFLGRISVLDAHGKKFFKGTKKGFYDYCLNEAAKNIANGNWSTPQSGNAEPMREAKPKPEYKARERTAAEIAEDARAWEEQEAKTRAYLKAKPQSGEATKPKEVASVISSAKEKEAVLKPAKCALSSSKEAARQAALKAAQGMTPKAKTLNIRDCWVSKEEFERRQGEKAQQAKKGE